MSLFSWEVRLLLVEGGVYEVNLANGGEDIGKVK